MASLSSPYVNVAVRCSPARTRGSQCLAACHMRSNGRAATGNHWGLISSDSTASPAQSAVVKISTSMSQDGCAGNRKVRCATASSESDVTQRPDSSLASRAAASAGDSPDSTWPPSPTILPVPSPVFLYPSSTSRSPSAAVLVSRHRQVDVRGTGQVSQKKCRPDHASSDHGGGGGKHGGDRVSRLRKSRGPRPRRRAQPGRERLVGEHGTDGGGQGPRVCGRDEQGGVLSGQVGDAACPRRHNGGAGAQRLLQNERLPLPEARQHEHPRPCEPRGNVIAVAEE